MAGSWIVYFLCKKEETIDHLLVQCPYSKKIWEEALKLTDRKGKWVKNIALYNALNTGMRIEQ